MFPLFYTEQRPLNLGTSSKLVKPLGSLKKSLTRKGSFIYKYADTALSGISLYFSATEQFACSLLCALGTVGELASTLSDIITFGCLSLCNPVTFSSWSMVRAGCPLDLLQLVRSQ